MADDLQKWTVPLVAIKLSGCGAVCKMDITQGTHHGIDSVRETVFSTAVKLGCTLEGEWEVGV